MKRLLPLALLAVLLGLVVLFIPCARPAHAATTDLTCTGTSTMTFQPGLLLTPQTVAVTTNEILSPCESVNTAITSGTSDRGVTQTLSCATVLAGVPRTITYQWSNGESSVVSYNIATNDVGGQTTITATGTVVSGIFAGDTAVEQTVFVTPGALQCLTPPGLTALGPGAVVLTITSA